MIESILRGDTITYVYTPEEHVHKDNIYAEIFKGVLTIGAGDCEDVEVDLNDEDYVIIIDSVSATFSEEENKLYVQFHIETDAPTIKIINIDYI